jgi:malate dehydrogenase (oxaloacetate-decarboxylating)
MKTAWRDDSGDWRTTLRGRQVLADPRLNKGTAFSDAERSELGITGLIPAARLTLPQQAARILAQYGSQPTDLARNVLLTEVHDRNEVLFYYAHRAPAGDAADRLHPDGRAGHRAIQPRVPAPARRLHLSVDHPEVIERSLLAAGLGPAGST